MKKAILLGFALLVVGKAAFGQHLGELSANYSYLHYVPVDNLPTPDLNGGGGAAASLHRDNNSPNSRFGRIWGR
jgi:hypothetical protein